MKKIRRVIRIVLLIYFGFSNYRYLNELFEGKRQEWSWADYLFFLMGLGYYIIEILAFIETKKKTGSKQ